MHVGATIRLLRIGAGVSLRDLAERIAVSSAYLSRVENGHDAAPTADRLEAIARELGLPASLLLDVAGRASPFIGAYMEEVPGASALFLEVARRNIDAAGIERLLRFVEREFPRENLAKEVEAPPLVPELTPGRVVVGVVASRVGDVLELLASRLADGTTRKAADLARELKERETQSPSLIGGGVMVPSVLVEGAPPAAALITLARPLKADTPDGRPVRVLVGLRSDARGWPHMSRLARVAWLARYGLAERLASAQTPDQVLAALAALDVAR